MMALTKLGFGKTISMIMCVLLLSCSTEISIKQKPGLLECILDQYISEHSINPKNTEIFISESLGWTDSSSLIRVLCYKKRKNIEYKDIFVGSYKNIDIYLEYGKLSNDRIELDHMNYSNIISNNIKWRRKKRNNLAMTKNHLTYPEEFNEVQIVYNPFEICIEDILMGSDKIKNHIQSKCLLCIK